MNIQLPEFIDREVSVKAAEGRPSFKIKLRIYLDDQERIEFNTGRQTGQDYGNGIRPGKNASISEIAEAEALLQEDSEREFVEIRLSEKGKVKSRQANPRYYLTSLLTQEGGIEEAERQLAQAKKAKSQS